MRRKIGTDVYKSSNTFCLGTGTLLFSTRISHEIDHKIGFTWIS